MTPRSKEKHFVVGRVSEFEPPSAQVDHVKLEAVHSRGAFVLHCRDLPDAAQWRQGWV